MGRHTMRAARLEAPGRFSIVEVPLLEPKSNEICIQLEGCGICASNLSPWEGKPWFSYPFEPGAPGHEGWGKIYSVGKDVKNFKPGARAGVLSLHAFAEFDVADENAAVFLPETLPCTAFPAEPLGCAVNVSQRAMFGRGQSVAIVGIGFLGAAVLRLAVLSGAQIIAITRRAEGLEMARLYGAQACIEMTDYWETIDRVKKFTNGRCCDVVVETTGHQLPLDLCGELTAERGRLVIAGYHQTPRQVNMQLWNWRGLDVINAHERDPAVYKRGMEKAVELVASGQLDPSPLYTHSFPLDRIADAFAAAAERSAGFMKSFVIYS